MSIAQSLRDTAQKLRRTPMPLADIIPLLNRAADALDAQGAAQEPDAWQYRVPRGDVAWSDWKPCDDSYHAETVRDQYGYEIRPLFAAPIPQPAAKEPITDEQIQHVYTQAFESSEGCARSAPKNLPPLVFKFARELLAFAAPIPPTGWINAENVIAECQREIERLDPAYTAGLDVAIDIIRAQALADAGQEMQPCGHPASLLIKSVESDHQFCELCETYDQKRDAIAHGEQLQADVHDLRVLTGRLILALRKADPNHKLPDEAMDFLRRKCLQGSPLRDATTPTGSSGDPADCAGNEGRV